MSITLRDRSKKSMSNGFEPPSLIRPTRLTDFAGDLVPMDAAAEFGIDDGPKLSLLDGNPSSAVELDAAVAIVDLIDELHFSGSRRSRNPFESDLAQSPDVFLVLVDSSPRISC